MNYVCVIVSACTILIGLTWLFEARKTYTPPVYEHCEFIFGSTTLGRLDSETGPDITDQQRKDASHHFGQCKTPNFVKTSDLYTFQCPRLCHKWLRTKPYGLF